MTNEEAARILTKAAEVIKERGWTQQTRQDGYGQVCLLGACDVAETGNARATLHTDLYGDFDTQSYRSTIKAMELAAKSLGYTKESVAAINDLEMTSQEDAILFLKHAAFAAENEL